MVLEHDMVLNETRKVTARVLRSGLVAGSPYELLVISRKRMTDIIHLIHRSLSELEDDWVILTSILMSILNSLYSYFFILISVSVFCFVCSKSCTSTYLFYGHKFIIMVINKITERQLLQFYSSISIPNFIISSLVLKDLRHSHESFWFYSQKFSYTIFIKKYNWPIVHRMSCLHRHVNFNNSKQIHYLYVIMRLMRVL